MHRRPPAAPQVLADPVPEASVADPSAPGGGPPGPPGPPCDSVPVMAKPAPTWTVSGSPAAVVAGYPNATIIPDRRRAVVQPGRGLADLPVEPGRLRDAGLDRLRPHPVPHVPPGPLVGEVVALGTVTPPGFDW